MNKFDGITTSIAAKMLGSSSQTVVNYCKRGFLRGYKNHIIGVWTIDLESVNIFLAKRGPVSTLDVAKKRNAAEKVTSLHREAVERLERAGDGYKMVTIGKSEELTYESD